MANPSNNKRNGNDNASLAMGRGARTLVSGKTFKIVFVAAVLLLAGFAWLISVAHPLPPHTITMATGPDGSSYAFLGKRYKILLAKSGIDVILKQTNGGVENLKLLRDPDSGVQLGFVEGGVAADTDNPSLVSLGTIGYEPVWFFSHKFATDRGIFTLKGRTVSVGPEGSDSRAFVDELLKRNSLGLDYFQAQALEPEQATAQLLAGKIDAAILMLNWGSPLVHRLVSTPGIDLASFSRADAYVAIFPSLYKLVLPAGVSDLEHNVPSHATTLLATKTSLIVRSDLHPALQYLLLEAASQIHSHAGIFQKAGEFPGAEALEIELSSDARHYYKSGKPFLQRYLPFWLAALVEQAIVLIIPILGLMYPLGKGMMSLYGWGMQRKIFLIYGELHWLEVEINKLGNKPPTEEILTRLKHLEERTNRVKVSSNYIPMLYSLKENISYVRTRLAQQGS